ncbi:MAG TPA: class I SAM-dependent methyltransferase [Hypericibacter adhaerens]|jgi:predicted O-methyltransferase YrrM|uniref:class I SAM-dependent methyltransferase n=1 Tax=Hypericibacter adhaerens TaxID=2602016 RepID=UPI002CC6B881|nr:class I SAM-dependent methyltransferase [Hypericibacter adhaerens]HWA45108.1 class I SAM-dependent methyltransferase [Hypericibacter adhaerens]
MTRGMSQEWIAGLFADPELLRMGHHQRAEDQNLGLGWLYYAFGRIVRPRLAVVVGSWRGFAPIMFAKALQDNLEQGEVVFIDPSLADDFWKDAGRVKDYFRQHGVGNVRHFPMTTQQFVTTADYRALGKLGLVFIDGLHTEAQASFDYAAFSPLLETRGFVMLHDSMIVRPDKVYGSEKAYGMSVKLFVDRLKQDPSLQLLDLPFGHTGVTLLRKLDEEATRDPYDWLDGGPR